jgi:hypothetical protein
LEVRGKNKKQGHGNRGELLERWRRSNGETIITFFLEGNAPPPMGPTS